MPTNQATSGQPQRRIVFYIDSLKTGGAERITLQLASWCARADWQPLLLTRRGEEHDFYPLPGTVERHIEAADPRWLRRLGWFGFPWRLLALRHWLVAQKIELAVGMTTLPAIKMLLASRGLGIACWVSERNYPPAKRPALPWRLLRRVTYPWADLHLVQTRQTGAWLRQHLGARRQLLLPNPILWPLPAFPPLLDPLELLPPPAGRADGGRARVVLAVGTKAHQKGFDRLVRAFARMAEAEPQLHLVLAGLDETPYHGENQVARLRALLPAGSSGRARLHFPGRVGNLADWYGACDLFVLASRYEGFPNVLLEAMAAGCACLACNCPTGPGELLVDGRNGLLLPAGASHNELAAAILCLVSDPQRRRSLGDKARVDVLQRFAESRIAAIFLEALPPRPDPAGQSPEASDG